ncbi:FAD-dependent monooxygenase [Leptospira koniambonensis]|uniref:FAD-dependent monooxygenase n=1 Tax=Leptospira koniambonensis TaxID=2484950 RepID=A0A4R9J815_9LEPT|nr:NAD(P)/FAD-dependent oxidoreductase [Leptospira koniambonensis]TGL33901.1 FAD-dependent monooxygenase [Leptospira koniambonensis]
MNKRKPSFLIVGSGIVGPSLALFLKRAGYGVRLLESYSHPAEDIGGALQIAPNGMKVIRELGLTSEILQIGTLSDEMIFRNHTGRLLSIIPNGSVSQFGESAIVVSRARFHLLLLEAAEKEGIPTEYGKKFSDAEFPLDGGVIAKFDDGSSVEADFLIGADGNHSKVRSFLFPNFPKPEYTGILNAGGFVPSEVIPEKYSKRGPINFTFGPEGFFGFAACGNTKDTSWMWWSNIPSEKELTREEIGSMSDESWKNKILKIHKGWHDPIEKIINASPIILKGNVHDLRSLPKWGNDKVLLIGDAAHVMSPHTGQGASMALEDSHILYLLLEKYESIEEAFKNFEIIRRPRVERIIEESRRNGSRKKKLSPLGCWIRDKFLTLALPSFAKKGQDWMYRYEGIK